MVYDRTQVFDVCASVSTLSGRVCGSVLVCVLQGNRHMQEIKSASDKTQTRLRARDVVPLLTKPRNNYSSAAQS